VHLKPTRKTPEGEWPREVIMDFCCVVDNEGEWPSPF
jgi:hypothetical protein